MIDYLKVPEVMEIYRVSYWTVLRWARKGRFSARKVGKSWYFNADEVKNAK